MFLFKKIFSPVYKNLITLPDNVLNQFRFSL